MKVNKQFPAYHKGEKETADPATNLVADYIARCAISRAAISRSTGISEGILRRCLVRRGRSLRANELLELCVFLGKNPMDFWAGRPGV